MPLPRFHRLPPERRAHILRVAREHIARDGTERASYNQIIADARISKTSAYLYFDGRDDLVDEVRRELAQRLSKALGPWKHARSSDELWSNLRAAGDRLRRHLAEHAEDFALVDRFGTTLVLPDADAWFAGVVRDGVRCGAVRADVDAELMILATKALFQALDAYVCDALARGREFDEEAVWDLVRGLWSEPREPRGAGRTRPKKRSRA